MTAKEHAFFACLSGLLANPQVTNIEALRRLDQNWINCVIHAADLLSERATSKAAGLQELEG